MAGAVVVLSGMPALAASAVVLRDLNVRAGPGTNFRAMGTLRAGTNIEVLSCTPAWCAIGWPGPAFVSAAYLGFNGPAPYVSGPLVVPAVPVGVPVGVPMGVPGVPVVVPEVQPAAVVVPPPPTYYNPPARVFVNPPGPVPGYYGAWGVWGW
ncbi:MAG: SH3 domain-containing protein [Pseudomonadota bacterium]